MPCLRQHFGEHLTFFMRKWRLRTLQQCVNHGVGSSSPLSFTEHSSSIEILSLDLQIEQKKLCSNILTTKRILSIMLWEQSTGSLISGSQLSQVTWLSLLRWIPVLLTVYLARALSWQLLTTGSFLASVSLSRCVLVYLLFLFLSFGCHLPKVLLIVQQLLTQQFRLIT